jgi:hypothetical protein
MCIFRAEEPCVQSAVLCNRAVFDSTHVTQAASATEQRLAATSHEEKQHCADEPLDLNRLDATNAPTQLLRQAHGDCTHRRQGVSASSAQMTRMARCTIARDRL